MYPALLPRSSSYSPKIRWHSDGPNTRLALAEMLSDIPAGTHAICLVDFNLHEIPSKQIVTAFQCVSEEVTTLDLGRNQLRNKKSRLAKVFSAIPQHIKILHLTENNFGRMLPADVETSFQAIPMNVKALNLSKNKLNFSSDFVKVVQGISRGITTLDLSDNLLHRKSEPILVKAFEAMPQYLTSLDLSCNFLGFKSSDELLKIISAIPKGVTWLNFSGNCLNDMSGSELALFFEAMPTALTMLDLSNNGLGLMRAELAQAVQAIPPQVTALNLSENEIDDMPGDELAQAFAAIPLHVTALNLSQNNLFKKLTKALTLAFKSIPTHIKTLDLSGNEFWQIKSDDMVLIFESIPVHVTTLNLSKNNLGNKPFDELATIFKKIPQNITGLNLSANVLYRHTIGHLAVLLNMIPPCHVVLGHNQLFFQKESCIVDQAFTWFSAHLLSSTCLLNNGSSILSRILPPLLSANRRYEANSTRKSSFSLRLCADVLNTVMSFLVQPLLEDPMAYYCDRYPPQFFGKKVRDLRSEVEHSRGIRKAV